MSEPNETNAAPEASGFIVKPRRDSYEHHMIEREVERLMAADDDEAPATWEAAYRIASFFVTKRLEDRRKVLGY